MDLDMTRDTIKMNKILCEEFAEVSIECDMKLADYYADVEKILKTEIEPQVLSKKNMGDKIVVEGNACITVYYAPSEDKTIRCVSSLQEFSKVFEIADIPMDAQLNTKTVLEYKNIRLTSPRKIEVRAAIGITLQVAAVDNQEYLADIEGSGIQKYKKKCDFSQFVGWGEKSMNISEEFEVPSVKPSILMILRKEAKAIIQDYKLITNKIIVKSDVLIKIVYISDDEYGRIESIEYTVPASQILDIEGMDETCGCDITQSLNSLTCEVSSKSNDENRIIKLDVNLMTGAKIYKHSEIMAVIDAFSTQYDTELKKGKACFETQLENQSLKNMEKFDLEFTGEDIAEVLDVWGNIRTLDTYLENNDIMIKNVLNLNAIVVTKAGDILCTEKDFEVNFAYQNNFIETDISCAASSSMTSVSYNFTSGNALEVRVEIQYNIKVYTNQYLDIMSDISLTEEKQEKVNKNLLTIYYADPGENIWDISKKYNTSLDLIMQENQLDEEMISNPMMLMIPSIKCE